MSSYREVYNAEIEGLFSKLRRTPLKDAVDNSVKQEGALGPLVPFSFNGADVFDSADTMDVLIYVPDEMVIVSKARAVLSFRNFFAPATAAASGGGSTSGASSSSSSGASSSTTTDDQSVSHSHTIGLYVDDVPPARTKREFTHVNGGGFNLETSTGEDFSTGFNPIAHGHSMPHTHGITHTHSTPAHAHDLTFGVYKEAFPASHSVELRIYEWDGAAWDLLDTITGLTDDLEIVDLGDSIDGPGQYRLSLKSAAAQPQGGRLGCDVAGHIVGAIQPL